MELIIGPKLKEYGEDREVILSLRELTLNSCCGGKIASKSNLKGKTPPQVVESGPKDGAINDYQKFNQDGITIYLHKDIVASYSKLRLDLKRFLWVKRFSVEVL